MRGQLEAWLRASWPSFGVGPLWPGAPLRVILVPGGGGDGWRHVGLVMRGPEEVPCLVVKYPRDVVDNDRIDAEAASLRTLTSWSAPTVGRFPLPLGNGVVADRAVSVESFTPGESLLMRMSRSRRQAEAAARRAAGLVDVLSELAVRSARPSSADELSQWIVNPLRNPPAALISSDADQGVVAGLCRRAVLLSDRAPLPAVFTHNDVAPPNVLVDHAGNFASLVDWESAGWGLPLTDVVYFLARVGTDSQDVALAAAITGSTPGEMASSYSRSVRPTLLRVCRECGIDVDWLPVVAVLTWLRHAAAESRRDPRGTRERESRRWLRRCLEALAGTEAIA